MGLLVAEREEMFSKITGDEREDVMLSLYKWTIAEDCTSAFLTYQITVDVERGLDCTYWETIWSATGSDLQQLIKEKEDEIIKLTGAWLYQELNRFVKEKEGDEEIGKK